MKVLFVAPHSFIWPHAYPEALVADALRSQGHEIVYVTCGKLLHEWCVPMESVGASESMPAESKSEICTQCEANARKINSRFAFNTTTLLSYTDSTDQFEVEKAISTMTAKNIIEIKVNNFEIGRAALYNYLLNHKTTVAELNENDLPALRMHLASTLRVFYAGGRLLARESPDRVVFYSSSYSANLVVLLQAQAQSIPCFSIYAGNNWATRLRNIHIASNDSFTQFENRNHLWNTHFRQIPATRDGLQSAQIFMKTLISGASSFLYGGKTQGASAEYLKSKFKIAPGQKVLFAATSSYDELAAAQVIRAIPENLSMAFENQLNWLSETVRFVGARKDLALIIRIHPREFPNQREKQASTHSRKLQEMLKYLPENVTVNWPEDKLSLYDFLEIIDLGLSAWSSAGKELAYWGIPNLTYVADLGFYPKSDLGYVAATPSEYFEKIDSALSEEFQPLRILTAYRWLAYELTEGVVDLADGISPRAFKNRTIIERITNKILGRRISDEERWYTGKTTPINSAAFIARRIETLKSVEETMLPHRERLTTRAEYGSIQNIVRNICRLRFGGKWLREPPKSKLQKNIQTFFNKNLG